MNFGNTQVTGFENATPESVSSLLSRGFNNNWEKIYVGEDDD